jgi:hypothetical protein
MKKIFLYVAAAILALIIVGYLVLNEKLPTGENPTKADELANKMLKALNKSAWDSTNVIAWTHKGGHQFVWDKRNELVQVKWDKNDVLLNLKEWNKGKAFSEGKEVTDGQLDVLRGKAWSIFCNDSYWLIAPYKVFDEGVTRKIVKSEDGLEALLVSYASGGVTPGDSYLWFLDKNATPTAYKMWVKILPIGGVSATWEDWKTTETGAIIAQNHKLGPLDLNVSDLRTGTDLVAAKVDAGLFDKIK